MALLNELAAWASTLELDEVPTRVVAFARSQVLSQLAAIRAGLSHPQGRLVVTAFGPPLGPDAKQSAAVLAGVSAWLHFDDTAYAGHLGNSTVTVPLAYAHALGLSGRELLTAVITANECAARITAAATLGPFRGQTAAHTHLSGTVAGRLRSAAAPAQTWVDAFGLAFGMPVWTLHRGFLGSDAKTLSAYTPVRIGLDACDAAIAGLHGAPDILEHPDGFLARFAAVPLPDAVTAGLGERWHTETLSFKMHPGGPGMDAAVDAAIELYGELGRIEPDAVERITVRSSLYTTLVDQSSAKYLTGPDSPVSALIFATRYALATVLLTGTLTAADFAPPAVHDPERWAFAGKIDLVHDEPMTTALFSGEAPLGEALRSAGSRAVDWLRDFGGQWLVDLVGEIPPPSADFESAAKITPASVHLKFADGREVHRQVDIPVGAIGDDTRKRHAGLVREKFLSTGGSPAVADAAAELERLSPADCTSLIDAALADRSTN
jgi:2-methylcitrate dehydratase PrpD